jgi:hypothetical protein
VNASLQRLRAEILFDRDAVARRIDELASLSLSDEALAELDAFDAFLAAAAAEDDP